MSTTRTFGAQLRDWRQRRHLSQLALAAEVNMSSRHLSFVETGRSQPSRAMVLRLADRLNVPLRERNALLTAAGYAPMYAVRAYSDPELAAARAAVDLILRGHDPYPAVLVDRGWNLIAANKAVGVLLAGVDASLMAPPVNALRVSLHPLGLASRIENLAQWRSHVLARLAREQQVSADPVLAELMKELSSYSAPGVAADATAKVSSSTVAASPIGAPKGERNTREARGFGNVGTDAGSRAGGNAGGTPDVAELPPGGIVLPLRLRTDAGVLSFFSTTTMFGTAVEITLSELMLEAFYPADEATAQALRNIAAAG